MKNRHIPLFCLVFVSLVLGSCEPPGDAAKPTDILAVEVDLLPDGSAMQGLAMYMKPDSLTPVMDPSVVVTVNGEALSPSFFGYMSSTLTAVSPGSAVGLHFDSGNVQLDRSLTMPAKPVVTAPASADPSGPITISWGALSPAPQYYYVLVSPLYTVSGNELQGTFDGSKTSCTIDAGTLLANDFLPVVVEAANVETSLGTLNLSMYDFVVANQTEVTIDTNP